MKKISFILLLLMSYSSYSQNYLGVSSSNYAGTMGMDIQPASFGSILSMFVIDRILAPNPMAIFGLM